MTTRGATGKPVAITIATVPGLCEQRKCIKQAGHPGPCWPKG